MTGKRKRCAITGKRHPVEHYIIFGKKAGYLVDHGAFWLRILLNARDERDFLVKCPRLILQRIEFFLPVCRDGKGCLRRELPQGRPDIEIGTKRDKNKNRGRNRHKHPPKTQEPEDFFAAIFFFRVDPEKAELAVLAARHKAADPRPQY